MTELINVESLEQYYKMRPIGIYAMTAFHGIGIFDILHGPDDTVIVGWLYEDKVSDVQECLTWYDEEMDDFVFEYHNDVYPLSEFIKTDS